jgi:hypothetical protein
MPAINGRVPEVDMLTPGATAAKTVYWHRDLPPIAAEAMEEHVIEATSARVAGNLAHRDELWERCYQDLMTEATRRLEQEVRRLSGRYAHVLNEVVESRRNDALNEAWLHGRFTYVLYGDTNEHAAHTQAGATTSRS